jgi:hypothetical protein
MADRANDGGVCIAESGIRRDTGGMPVPGRKQRHADEIIWGVGSMFFRVYDLCWNWLLSAH